MKKYLLPFFCSIVLSFVSNEEPPECVTKPMVLVFDTKLSDGTTIALPLRENVNVTVDWGDGKREIVRCDCNCEHTYRREGVYEVKICGSLSWYGVDFELKGGRHEYSHQPESSRC
ncbi:MAG: hypothetical protein ACOC41_03885 [Chitinivibrionales bacterium]